MIYVPTWQPLMIVDDCAVCVVVVVEVVVVVVVVVVAKPHALRMRIQRFARDSLGGHPWRHHPWRLSKVHEPRHGRLQHDYTPQPAYCTRYPVFFGHAIEKTTHTHTPSELFFFQFTIWHKNRNFKKWVPLFEVFRSFSIRFSLPFRSTPHPGFQSPPGFLHFWFLADNLYININLHLWLSTGWGVDPTPNIPWAQIQRDVVPPTPPAPNLPVKIRLLVLQKRWFWWVFELEVDWEKMQFCMVIYGYILLLFHMIATRMLMVVRNDWLKEMSRAISLKYRR